MFSHAQVEQPKPKAKVVNTAIKQSGEGEGDVIVMMTTGPTVKAQLLDNSPTR